MRSADGLGLAMAGLGWAGPAGRVPDRWGRCGRRHRLVRLDVTPALDLLTDALAVHRLTRLVTEDDLTEPLRDRLIEAAYNLAGRPLPEGWEGQSLTERAANDAHAPKLATLLVCKWCSSMHCAAAAVVLSRVAPKAWRPLSRMLALSSAGTLLAGLEDG